MTITLSLDDVRRAAVSIAPDIVRTPFSYSRAFSALLGAEVFLKLENRQYTGSFKERGALTKLQSLDRAERDAGVIAMSAGNHAQAVAYHATRMGVPATIVMPTTTPYLKVRRTRGFGATVELAGATLFESAERARELAAARGLTFIHPYDDAAVIAGQGTVALEMLADEQLDTIVVPIGGGGLIAGTAVAAKALAMGIEIVGVETQAYPSMVRLLAGLPPIEGGQTIAEGIAVKTIGTLPLAIARELVDRVDLVDDLAIERAIHLFLEAEKLVVEGAGAAGLALMLSEPERYAGKRVGLIVCGGNIDTGLLASVIERVRLHERRVHRLRVTIPDHPGTLAHVAALIGAVGANILDVQHHRQFSDVNAKGAFLAISLETQDPADIHVIVAELVARGYPTIPADH